MGHLPAVLPLWLRLHTPPPALSSPRVSVTTKRHVGRHAEPK
jgi:hypothetical protein